MLSVSNNRTVIANEMQYVNHMLQRVRLCKLEKVDLTPTIPVYRCYITRDFGWPRLWSFNLFFCTFYGFMKIFLNNKIQNFWVTSRILQLILWQSKIYIYKISDVFIQFIKVQLVRLLTKRRHFLRCSFTFGRDWIFC